MVVLDDNTEVYIRPCSENGHLLLSSVFRPECLIKTIQTTLNFDTSYMAFSDLHICFEAMKDKSVCKFLCDNLDLVDGMVLVYVRTPKDKSGYFGKFYVRKRKISLDSVKCNLVSVGALFPITNDRKEIVNMNAYDICDEYSGFERIMKLLEYTIDENESVKRAYQEEIRGLKERLEKHEDVHDCVGETIDEDDNEEEYDDEDEEDESYNGFYNNND